MISLIIVDYKSIPKTMNYIQDCLQAFTRNGKEAMDKKIHVILVDNSPDEQSGLAYLQQECHAQIEPMQITALDRAKNPLQAKDTHEVNTLQYEEKERYVYQCHIHDTCDIEVIYVAARENLGYAKGNNLGADIARQLYQDCYYLFSNNDLQFPETFDLEQLLKPMQEQERVAVVGPKVVTKSGEQQSPRKMPRVGQELFGYYWNLLLPKKWKLEHTASGVDEGRASGICDWLTGSFWIMEAVKFHEVGGFDAHTFLFYEELILKERLRKAGYSMYYCDVVTVIHAHGETVKSTLGVLKGIESSFQSSLYYFKEYRGVSKVVILMARCNYRVCMTLFRLKKAIMKGMEVAR